MTKSKFLLFKTLRLILITLIIVGCLIIPISLLGVGVNLLGIKYFTLIPIIILILLGFSKIFNYTHDKIYLQQSRSGIRIPKFLFLNSEFKTTLLRYKIGDIFNIKRIEGITYLIKDDLKIKIKNKDIDRFFMESNDHYLRIDGKLNESINHIVFKLCLVGVKSPEIRKESYNFTSLKSLRRVYRPSYNEKILLEFFLNERPKENQTYKLCFSENFRDKNNKINNNYLDELSDLIMEYKRNGRDGILNNPIDDIFWLEIKSNNHPKKQTSLLNLTHGDDLDKIIRSYLSGCKFNIEFVEKSKKSYEKIIEESGLQKKDVLSGYHFSLSFIDTTTPT